MGRSPDAISYVVYPVRNPLAAIRVPITVFVERLDAYYFHVVAACSFSRCTAPCLFPNREQW